jgi:amino acid transporter
VVYSTLLRRTRVDGSDFRSAYTYSYATLGELVAWIIGWDLIIEYAIGNVAVAISWAEFFNRLLRNLGIHMPDWLTSNYRTATDETLAAAPHIFGVPIVFNILAFGIVALITVGARVGHQGIVKLQRGDGVHQDPRCCCSSSGSRFTTSRQRR